jgi:hypothetical protein
MKMTELDLTGRSFCWGFFFLLEFYLDLHTHLPHRFVKFLKKETVSESALSPGRVSHIHYNQNCVTSVACTGVGGGGEEKLKGAVQTSVMQD